MAGSARAAIAGALAGSLLLGGCAPGAGGDATHGEPDRAADRPKVVTTFTVLADIAANVAGEHLIVESITKVGAEVHGYEPTPGDIRRAADADLILDHGLGLERWFEQFVAELDVPHVVVTDGIEPIPIAGDEAETGSSATTGAPPNPHTWMSPANVAQYVETIADAFAELDPAHAEEYDANARAYQSELHAIQDRLIAELATLPPSQRALVTCEGAFSYLARDAGLTEHYLWPVNAEQQATPQQVARTIETVRDAGIPAVFCESTVSDRAMQQVVDATDAVYGGVLYVDSLSEPDGPVPTYLDLIRYDTELIIAGLTGGTR